MRVRVLEQAMNELEKLFKDCEAEVDTDRRGLIRRGY